MRIIKCLLSLTDEGPKERNEEDEYDRNDSDDDYGHRKPKK